MKITLRRSPFIKQFDGPGDNSIICFRFWQAVIASGCPGECAYCFLQTLQPYRRGLYDLKGTLFSNILDIVPEVVAWLDNPIPAGLIVGENQDGLAFERPYKKLLGVTPLELMIPLFEECNPAGHVLIVLSKFTSTVYAESFGPARNVVFSWSLSLPTISDRYEKGVASLDHRIIKARKLRDAGYRIRFRLDALAPVPGWRHDLAKLLQEINSVGPEMLTLGSLRASNQGALRRAAQKNQRDDSIFDYLTAKDPSGFKYRTDSSFYLSAYNFIRETLDSSIPLGLCKEDQSVWRESGIRWHGCHCLHGQRDQVVVERMRLPSLLPIL